MSIAKTQRPVGATGKQSRPIDAGCRAACTGEGRRKTHGNGGASSPHPRGDDKTTSQVAQGARRKSHPPSHRGKSATANVSQSARRKSQGVGYVCPRLAAIKARFAEHYYYSDDDVIDVVLGTVAGNDLPGDPLWLYLIGPPSAGKTELLYSIFECPET